MRSTRYASRNNASSGISGNRFGSCNGYAHYRRGVGGGTFSAHSSNLATSLPINSLSNIDDFRKKLHACNAIFQRKQQQQQYFRQYSKSTTITTAAAVNQDQDAAVTTTTRLGVGYPRRKFNTSTGNTIVPPVTAPLSHLASLPPISSSSSYTSSVAAVNSLHHFFCKGLMTTTDTPAHTSLVPTTEAMDHQHHYHYDNIGNGSDDNPFYDFYQC